MEASFMESKKVKLKYYNGIFSVTPDILDIIKNSDHIKKRLLELQDDRQQLKKECQEIIVKEVRDIIEQLTDDELINYLELFEWSSII